MAQIEGKPRSKPRSKALISPTGARAVPWNVSNSEGDVLEAKEAGQLQEKQGDPKDNQLNQGQQHQGSQSADSHGSDKPARRTRSSRAMHSLRKSLAWDKAFSTEEGILDGDELSLVAKTPKKLPDLPPLSLPDILAFMSPATKPAPISTLEAPKSVPSEPVAAAKPMSDISEHHPNTRGLGTINVTEPSRDLEKTEALSTTGNANTPILNAARHWTSQSSSSAIISPIHGKALSAIPRPVPVTQVIEDAVEKGTKLRLPNSLVHTHSKLEKGSEEPVRHEVNSKPQKDLESVAKHRKDTEQTLLVKPLKDMHTLTRCRSTSSLIKQSSTSTSISKKVSSVSKKVKDTLGRVLPGSMGGRPSASRKAMAETAHADRLRQPTSVPQSSSTGIKVPGSPGPSYLTRSKSARGAVNGVTAEASVQKTGVLAELSNKSDSTNVPSKLPPVQKKSKGERIWGSIRGRGGSSSTKGTENVPLSTSIPSPLALKKTGGTNSDLEVEASHSKTSRDLSSQISKPSGLRLPSPKIGFFDAGRAAGSHEKPTVGATDVMARQGLPPRPPSQHGSTSARFAPPATVDPLITAVRGYLSSGIPVAPHVTRPSGKGMRKGLVPSASAPASPRKNSEMLSPGTHQAVTGRYLTSRSNFTRINIEASPEPRKEASGAARKLTLEHCDGKLRHIAGDAEGAATKESSPLTLGCGEDVQNAEDTPRIECCNQPSDMIVDSTIVTEMTDTAKVLPKQPVEEKRNEICREFSSGTVTRLEMSPSSDNGIKEAASSEDFAYRGSGDDSLEEPKSECINLLVESLHNSPSIQSTFWELQGSCAPPTENLVCNDTRNSSSEDCPSSEVKFADQFEDGASDGAENVPKELDGVGNVTPVDEHHKKISSEHARSSTGGGHGRRKSIFGWQDMHASLASPVSNATVSNDQAIGTQESESSVSPSVTGKNVENGPPSHLSTTIQSPMLERRSDVDFLAKQMVKIKNQEPGQIMNGAVIEDLRAESFKQESPWNSKAHCLSSAEKKEETSKVTSPPVKTPDKENLQNKLENLFEAHWSGWPVVETAKPGSSSTHPKEAYRVSGSPKPAQGLDDAEKSHNQNCGSFNLAASPAPDADTTAEIRNPLAVNRALLNTAADGSRLSITPPLKKERGLLALARSAVSRLTSAASGGLSPRDENSGAIDRDGPGSGSFRKSRRHKSNSTSKPVDLPEGNGNAEFVSPTSEERLRALESAVEEAILMKRGGAVQHSPPNKTQPPPNPWSPVKKGPHPGPFDCTKKTAVNTLVL